MRKREFNANPGPCKRKPAKDSKGLSTKDFQIYLSST
jgi:hypothetical protein